MKNLIIIIVLVLTCNMGQTQNVMSITSEDIPLNIKVKGVFAEGYKWFDKNGCNILVLSKKGPFQESKSINTDGSGMSVYLYAEQYIVNNDSIKLLWDIVDFETQCLFDITGDFLDNSTTITDLDNDGITETTIIYKLACRSDITPASMKILLHENGIKYGLRGTMIWTNYPPFNSIDFDKFEFNLSKITKSSKEYDFEYKDFGRYNNEDDFRKVPPEFINYIRKKWRAFVIEVY